jgi:hypothetical protein
VTQLQELTPASGGEAGYATLARLLSAFYAAEVESRQVYAWHTRETRNKDGEPFPAPVRENVKMRRGQARYMFSVPQVLAWFGKGVPGEHGKGWLVPQPRPFGVAAQKWNETAP